MCQSDFLFSSNLLCKLNCSEESLWPTVPSVTIPLVTTSLWLGAVLRAALFGVLTVTVWDLWGRGWDREFKARRVHAAISAKLSGSSWCYCFKRFRDTAEVAITSKLLQK